MCHIEVSPSSDGNLTMTRSSSAPKEKGSIKFQTRERINGLPLLSCPALGLCFCTKAWQCVGLDLWQESNDVLYENLGWNLE